MGNMNDIAMQKQSINKRITERGHAIYDEWQTKRFSSKVIVSCVEEAMHVVEQSKETAAYVEALVCLLALDIRMKKKYKSFLHCMVALLSWRREARALNRLKRSLRLLDINGW